MDPQLKSQLRQLITYANSTATANAFGEVQVGSAATALVRIQPTRREYEQFDGTMERTTHMVIMDGCSTTPTFESRFWLLEGSPNTAAMARRPKIIHPCFGEFGELDHWEIFL